ncbi:MAG: metallophosphoesterase [Planctomycetaceae bacterium]
MCLTRMRITTFNTKPIYSIPFLNAGRRPNQFYTDKLLVYHGQVDGLPDSIDCIIATADLQGREMLRPKPKGPPRLLGEVLPNLIEDVLCDLGLIDMDRILTLLAGDFYTYEDLRGRGGTGNVDSVWEAMSNAYGWVAGVAGNHDMFGSKQSTLRTFNPTTHLLDADSVDIEGISIAGLSGIIGNPKKNFRRTSEDFLDTLKLLLLDQPSIVLMHDGPDARTLKHGKGNPDVREVLERTSPPLLVVRGHSHWSEPLVELKNGVQVLNVDCTVAILTRA